MTSRHPAVSCACPKCQSERRTPLAPAAEEREAVALAMLNGKRLREGWPITASIPEGFADGDEWRLEAQDALSALAPIRAQEIAAARAEEQGYRHTQVAALKQVHAAEILAAEARGMGRARTVVQNTRDGMKFDPSATLEWRNAITGGFNAADLALRHELDAVEPNEHGEGK